MLARKLKEGDLKILWLGVGAGAWSTQLFGPGVQNGRTPEVTHSFRGLDGEVNEPDYFLGAVRQGFSFSLPTTTHTAFPTPEQSQLRLEAGLPEAVVAEAGRLSCFGEILFLTQFSLLHSVSFIPSRATAVCLPQLSSTRHTAAAQG